MEYPTSGVRVFFSSSHTELGANLADWLRQRPGEITLQGIGLDSNQWGHSLAVAYSEEPGPQYWVGLFFSEQHHSVEAEAQEALRREPPRRHRFVALGSNQYGHCLCLIAEA